MAALAVVIVALGGAAVWVVLKRRDDPCERYAARVDALQARLAARNATEAEETRAILRIAAQQPDGCDVFVPELLAPARL